MNDKYEQKLLADWEAIFQQGLLTFWVFVALVDHELSVSDIKQRVEELTENTYAAAEQTLYRLLRKHYELELVDYKEIPSDNGPNKKIYSLSPLGLKLLKQFSQRNINLFYQKNVRALTEREGEVS